ncbi:MAG: CDP-alcohol phosphatidyltransferase family protein [Pseudomonadota bacterium]
MTLSWLPNAITVVRCGLAFACAFAVLAGEALSRRLDTGLAQWRDAGSPAPSAADYPATLLDTAPGDLIFWPSLAFGFFVLAAVSDFADGALARALDAASAFGAWLDPVADKLLVGLTLVALSVTGNALLLSVPAAVIISRDIYVTWLRARQGGGLALPVMATAKWKTALEMVAIALLLALPLLAALLHVFGAPAPAGLGGLAVLATSEWLGIGLLWSAAALSVWTGHKYRRAFHQGPAEEFG